MAIDLSRLSRQIKDKWVFTAIFLLGAGLRVWRAFFISDINQDEAITYHEVISNSFANLFERLNYVDHTHPPFLFVLHKTWLALLGNEHTFRIPSFLFSIFSILLVIKISKKLFYKNRPLMFLIPLYFCTSGFFILFGVFFRTYALEFLLGLLLLGLYIDCYSIEAKNKKISGLQFCTLAALAGLALFTDYSAIWLIIPILLFAFLHRQYKKYSFVAITLGLLLNIPWFLFSLRDNFHFILEAKKNTIPAFTSGYDFLTVLARFFDVDSLINNSGEAYSLFLLLLIVASVWGLMRYYSKDRALVQFLLLALAFPYLVTVIYSLKFSPIFDHKNLWFSNFILVAGLLLFCSEVVPVAYRKWTYLGLFSLQALTLSLSSPGVNMGAVKFFPSAQIKDIFKYIKEHEKGRPAALCFAEELSSMTPEIYQLWYYADDPVHIVMASAPEMIKADLAQGRSLYYFDYSDEHNFNRNAENSKRLEDLGGELHCRFKDVVEFEGEGIFKKCSLDTVAKPH